MQDYTDIFLTLLLNKS